MPVFSFKFIHTSYNQGGFISHCPDCSTDPNGATLTPFAQLTQIAPLTLNAALNLNCATDPHCATDPDCTTDPECATDPNYATDPDCTTDPKWTTDPDCATDPKCTTNPDCATNQYKYNVECTLTFKGNKLLSFWFLIETIFPSLGFLFLFQNYLNIIWLSWDLWKNRWLFSDV